MQYNAVEEVEEGMSNALPIELQGITMHYNYKAMWYNQCNALQCSGGGRYVGETAQPQPPHCRIISCTLCFPSLFAYFPYLFVFLLCLLNFPFICLFAEFFMIFFHGLSSHWYFPVLNQSCQILLRIWTIIRISLLTRSLGFPQFWWKGVKCDRTYLTPQCQRRCWINFPH